MKRICFYSVATHMGGAERSLLDLLVGLQADPQKRYEPWVLLPKKDGPLVELLQKNNIKYSVLPMPDLFFRMSRENPFSAVLRGAVSTAPMILYFAKLCREIRRANTDLIHTTGIKCHGLSALTQRIVARPVLWHLRDILRPGVTLTALKVLRKTPGVHVIANSIATAQAFDSHARNILAVYNGLDPSLYKRQPNGKYREALRVNESVPIIGIVGVLARWKGQLEFLEMAKRLVDSGVDARFVIIGGKIYDTSGDENFEEVLRRRCADLGLTEYVHFAGFEKDTIAAMNGLDILVHASTRPEPFGRVIVEAMACGVPVVASGAGGVLEIVDDGVDGLIYEPGNVSSMSAAVKSLVKNKELRTRLAHAGQKKFLKRFTIQAHVDGVMRVYDSIFASEAVHV